MRAFLHPAGMGPGGCLCRPPYGYISTLRLHMTLERTLHFRT